MIGRELATGNTVEVKVTEDEIRKAIGEPVRGIVDAARLTLAEAPPELTHDVLETGMFLTGGGALLRGFDMLLAQECEVPVHVVERPLETVAIGAGPHARAPRGLPIGVPARAAPLTASTVAGPQAPASETRRRSRTNEGPQRERERDRADRRPRSRGPSHRRAAHATTARRARPGCSPPAPRRGARWTRAPNGASGFAAGPRRRPRRPGRESGSARPSSGLAPGREPEDEHADGNSDRRSTSTVPTDSVLLSARTSVLRAQGFREGTRLRSPVLSMPTMRRTARIVALVVLFALAFAAAWIRLPYYAVGPGPANDVAPLIDVQGCPGTRPRARSS